MLYLTRYLGVVIGDKIPPNNEHWKMYIQLRKIVDTLISLRMVNAHLTTLMQLVENLNSAYLHFYKALKPKFHFLTLYASIMYFFFFFFFWAMCKLFGNAK